MGNFNSKNIGMAAEEPNLITNRPDLIRNTTIFKAQKSTSIPTGASYTKIHKQRSQSRNLDNGKMKNCQLKFELTQKMNEIFELREENGFLKKQLKQSDDLCSRLKKSYEELSSKYQNLVKSKSLFGNESGVSISSPFKDLTKDGDNKENYLSNCFRKKIKKISIDPKGASDGSKESPELDFRSNKYSMKSSDQCIIETFNDLSSIEHTKSHSIAHNLIPLLEQKVKNTEKEYEKKIKLIHKVSTRVSGNVEKLLVSLNLEEMMMMRIKTPSSPNEKVSPLVKDIHQMEGVVHSLKIIFKHVIDREIEERLLEFEGDILRNINYHETKLGILGQKILKLNSVILKKKILKKKKEKATDPNHLKTTSDGLMDVKNLLESILGMFPRVEKISMKMKRILEEVQNVKKEDTTEDPLIQGRFDIIVFTLDQLSQKFDKTYSKLEEFKALTTKRNLFY